MTLSFEEQLRMEEKESRSVMEKVDPYGFKTAFEIWEEMRKKNGDHG